MSLEMNRTAEFADPILLDGQRRQELLENRQKLHRDAYHASKRFFDITGALVGVVMLVPVTILVKLAMMLTGDFAPIFYKQERIGKNGKAFKLYKFRSMMRDADSKLEGILANNHQLAAEYRSLQKLNDDPRVTKVGKFLRKSSLDELPQCLNVLMGQMSLIGPRPLVPGELKRHYGRAEIYYSVKPGLTGYWAVQGRSGVSYRRRLELEYYYVENASARLDAKIFIMTVGAVVKGDGAK